MTERKTQTDAHYRKHLYVSNENTSWTNHLVVFCDVSDLVGGDKVYEAVSIKLLEFGKSDVLLVVISL